MVETNTGNEPLAVHHNWQTTYCDSVEFPSNVWTVCDILSSYGPVWDKGYCDEA